MNCNKCNSSWTSTGMVTKCPFCGADIVGEETQKPNIYDNSKDALVHIMHVHGADVLLGSMLKSFFNDYAPRVETLRKNVIFFVSSSGAADILKRNMPADDMGHESAFRQAVQRVIDTYGIERGLVESVVSEFTDALGWKIKITQTSNTAAEMQHVGTQQVQQVQMQTQPTQVRYAENVQNVDISTLKIGQRNVKFGRYNWRVLDVQSGKALLLAEDIIERRPYNNEYINVTWESCTLRGYLNGEFLKTFSNEERSRIALTNVRNENNQWYGINGGSDTRDNVFLLSIEEVVRYFGDSGQLRNRPKKDSWYIDDRYNDERVAKYEGKATWWWLRSPGYYSRSAALVGTNGAVFIYGTFVYFDYGGVRPALWLNL